MAKKNKDEDEQKDQEHEKKVQLLLRRRPPMPKLRDLPYPEQVNAILDEIQVEVDSLDEVKDHVFWEHQGGESGKDSGGPLNILHRNEIESIALKRTLVLKNLSEVSKQHSEILGESGTDLSLCCQSTVTEVTGDVRASLTEMMGERITEDNITKFFNILGQKLSNPNNHIEKRVAARLAAVKKKPKELIDKFE